MTEPSISSLSSESPTNLMATNHPSTTASPTPPYNNPPGPYNFSPLNTNVNVKNVISLELTFTNYLNWQKVMIKFLGSQKLRFIVDGSVPCPPADHPQFATWIQYDDLVQSWINATLSLLIPETFLNHDCTSALDAWTTLNRLFLYHAQPTRMNLLSQFQAYRKGDNPMAEFLQHIHNRW